MTKKRLMIVTGVLALVAVLGVVTVGGAFAQTSTPGTETQTTPDVDRPQRGLPAFGFGMRGGSTESFDAVAEALGLTPTQLFEELDSGKTLSEIAEAQGVDLTAIEDVMKTSRTEAMKDRIAQAVEDGTMTQEQADWLLLGIEKGWTSGGRSFGFDFGGRGHGRGMKGMRGMPFGDTEQTPSTSVPGTES